MSEFNKPLGDPTFDFQKADTELFLMDIENKRPQRIENIIEEIKYTLSNIESEVGMTNASIRELSNQLQGLENYIVFASRSPKRDGVLQTLVFIILCLMIYSIFFN